MAPSILLFVLTLTILIFKSQSTNVLVTGGAGFIGFHIGQRLIEDDSTHVVVLDNFDDSYSIDLKRNRADILKNKGVTVHDGSVCNVQLLEYLFEQYQFEHVVHLASKDGHAASMDDPGTFVTANTECLLTLLKVLSSNQSTHLVYTSSYNVLDVNDPWDASPISLYTALKTGGERFVTSFCHKYGISTVGIRPFSVYGPWGRPDGDIYKMALEIKNGKKVELHWSSRDYTYVSDVVSGIVAAMNYRPKQCGVIFNIGSGAEPVSMEDVLDLLNHEMKSSAEKEFKPVPLYEPSKTQCDISESVKELGYSPQTTLKDGIKKFVSWFNEYHGKKKDKSQPKPDDSLAKKLKKDEIMYLNKKYKKRIVSIRQEYEKKAAVNNLPVVKYYPKKFLKFRGIVAHSLAYNFKKYAKISLQTVEDWCNLIDECVAFTSRGFLYSYIPPKKNWRRTSSTDFYVANIDICKAGLTSCYGNCTCKYIGPSQAEYGCHDGFGILDKGSQQKYCYELYVPGKATSKENEFKILDKIEKRNWSDLIKGKDFKKISHKYVDYGVVAYYPEAANDIDKLKTACRNTYHCIGFSTNGELKGIIDHVHKWKKSKQDMYLLDINYCTMHEEKCNCHRSSPGVYSCRGRKT